MYSRFKSSLLAKLKFSPPDKSPVISISTPICPQQSDHAPSTDLPFAIEDLSFSGSPPSSSSSASSAHNSSTHCRVCNSVLSNSNSNSNSNSDSISGCDEMLPHFAISWEVNVSIFQIYYF